MNIAVVDDDAADLDAAVRHLREYVDIDYPQADIHIATFAGGENLLKDFEADTYDLIVLDIYMKGISGMETAKAIRQVDAEVAIIFLTSSEEHILEGYRVYAAGYFIKPLAENKEEFTETLDHIFPRLRERRKAICLCIEGAAYRVPYRDILYVDIRDIRKPCFHLYGRALLSSMSYEKCRDTLLKDSRFLECHHRIIANMDCVESMEQDDFLLKDGTRIPISRRKRQDVKIAYMNHLLEL